MHKESGQVVAIKQVPVDTDIQEIIKEISMMQQCDRWITLTFTLPQSFDVYYFLLVSQTVLSCNVSVCLLTP